MSISEIKQPTEMVSVPRDSFAHPPNIPFLSFVSKQDLRTLVPLVSKTWRQHSQQEFGTRFHDLSNLHRNLAPHRVRLTKLQFQRHVVTLSELREKIEAFYQNAEVPGTNVLICFYPNGTEYLRIVITTEQDPMIRDIPQGRLLFKADPGLYDLENVQTYVLTDVSFQHDQKESGLVANKSPYYLMNSATREMSYRVKSGWNKHRVIKTTIQARYPYEVNKEEMLLKLMTAEDREKVENDPRMLQEMTIKYSRVMADQERADQEMLQEMMAEYTECIGTLKEYVLDTAEKRAFHVLNQGDNRLLKRFLKSLLNQLEISSEINLSDMDKYLLNQSMTELFYKPALRSVLTSTRMHPFLGTGGFLRSTLTILPILERLQKFAIQNPDNFSWAYQRFKRELEFNQDLLAIGYMAYLENKFNRKLLNREAAAPQLFNREDGGIEMSGPDREQVALIAKLRKQANDSMIPPLLGEVLGVCIEAENHLK